MANTRDIKRRIKSISSTKKITKAMEMVAAAKMRKAVAQVVISRQYADHAWKIVQKISKSKVGKKHVFLRQPKKINKSAILAISSNRGLCGGFNSNLAKEVIRTYKHYQSLNIQCDFITFGQKAAREIRKKNLNIIADFDKPDLMQDITSIDSIVQLLLNGFKQKSYQEIVLVYTDFQSSLTQIPTSKILLPLTPVIDPNLGIIGNNSNYPKDKPAQENINIDEYKFEPSPKEVLDEILPRILELQIYQACLESDASEHSARMVAMRNAFTAATDMIDELNLIYNKARQTAITQEIAEIVAGANAI